MTKFKNIANANEEIERLNSLIQIKDLDYEKLSKLNEANEEKLQNQVDLVKSLEEEIELLNKRLSISKDVKDNLKDKFYEQNQIALSRAETMERSINAINNLSILLMENKCRNERNGK